MKFVRASIFHRRSKLNLGLSPEKIFRSVPVQLSTAPFFLLVSTFCSKHGLVTSNLTSNTEQFELHV